MRATNISLGLLLAGMTLAFNNPTFLTPVFPVPLNLGTNEAWHSIRQTITSNLTGAIAAANGGAGANSLAIRATSVKEDSPLFEFYHTAKSVSPAGVQTVGADTVFRVGSVSKLFTVYSLLVRGGFDVFDDPVTKYVPELREAGLNSNFDPLEDVSWEEVTVGALASQLSGILRDYNHADLSTQGVPVEAFGLPPLPPHHIPKCDGNESQPPCTRKEFLQGLQGLDKQPPVFPVWATPSYSNANFRILSYVFESITNMSFATGVEKDVLRPLDLSNTYTIKPQDSVGIIPTGVSLWGQFLGQDLADAGFYSSAKDLCNFGRAILDSSQLTPAETRRWLKPHSHTASLLLSVGMPWEIYRQQTGEHVVDFYTKDGSYGAYNSILILVPDYGMVFSVLTAGPDSNLVINAAEIVRQNIMPALEAAARKQAKTQYEGKYCLSSGGQMTDLIALSVDDGTGLLVDKWISNGQDFLAIASQYAEDTGSGPLQTVRLYPTELQAAGKVAFRAVFNTSGGRTGAGAPRLFSPGVEAWSSVDNLVYGQKPMDLFLFDIDFHGVARTVECSGLRKVLPKC
ncbi:hypothetical protein N7474_000359 [Penicillium riverlandense]|uniref:uncharacterized protein n=1 Tax=Penicillium riverlandense TaxID=1903569 RepID=UPI002549378E|nr:uncharacterized protein N7474_000359 [Penicillium riverlandense]KAJ5832048.1 hypothetical protein N7474_000359 [Penicillium riverlandense]